MIEDKTAQKNRNNLQAKMKKKLKTKITELNKGKNN